MVARDVASSTLAGDGGDWTTALSGNAATRLADAIRFVHYATISTPIW